MTEEAPTTVDLDWKGPYSLAQMADRAPTASVSGVYLLIRHLDSRPSVYVGSSANVQRRLQAHVAGVLGLTYYIREAGGDWYPSESPSKIYWDRLQHLDREIELAKNAIRTTSFAWAETARDLVGAVERRIYLLLEDRGDLVYMDTTKPIERRRGQSHSPVDIKCMGSQEIAQLLGVK